MTAWGWWALAVSLLGLLLRVEHALTFDHVNRASDYAVHLPAVRWTPQHWTAFFHTTEISYQIRSYPPLWYFGSALILKLTDSERALAILSLIGFVLRHSALVLALRQAIPERPLSRLTAITIHALLPLGVLIDGKVNPESLHSGIFSLALYFLWRMERQAQTPAGMSIGSAAWFGGLALTSR